MTRDPEFAAIVERISALTGSSGGFAADRCSFDAAETMREAIRKKLPGTSEALLDVVAAAMTMGYYAAIEDIKGGAFSESGYTYREM